MTSETHSSPGRPTPVSSLRRSRPGRWRGVAWAAGWSLAGVFAPDPAARAAGLEPTDRPSLVAGGRFDREALRQGILGPSDPVPAGGLLLTIAGQPGVVNGRAGSLGLGVGPGLRPEVASVWVREQHLARLSSWHRPEPANDVGIPGLGTGPLSRVMAGFLDRWIAPGHGLSREDGGVVMQETSMRVGGFDLPMPAGAAVPQVMAAASAGAGLTLVLGTGPTVALQPGMAGQGIDVFLRNAGTGLSIGGLDLKLSLAGGGGVGAPAIEGVDLRSGLLFTPSNASQGADPANSGSVQFWSVSLNDPFAPPALIGGGASTRIGTISLSTVGVTAGTWSLSALLPESGLFDPFGDTLSMALSNTTLQVVPEASTLTAVSGLAVLGWAILRPRRSRAGAVGREG